MLDDVFSLIENYLVCGRSFDACVNLFLVYSMIGLLRYKFEPFWQDVSVKSLIIKGPLRPVGLLLYFVNVFSLFRNISPCKRGERVWSFIWTNLNFLYPRMICAKLGWKWPGGSGEEKFTDGRTAGDQKSSISAQVRL